MTAPAVKICGLREAAHLAAAARAGTTMIGFVFAPSKRRIAPAAAAALIAGLRAAWGAQAPLCVGLFVNEDPAQMATVVRECGLDLVQLSGDEAPDADLLITLGCPVIRILRPAPLAGQGSAPGPSLPPTVQGQIPVLQRHAVPGLDTPAARGLAELDIITNAWQAAAAVADDRAGPVHGPWGSRLLIGLDAAHSGAYGGTGVLTDWALAAALAARGPLMLAGGLTPANVAASIAAVQPWAVDVSSGVETAGVKDPTLIAAFVRAARDE